MQAKMKTGPLFHLGIKEIMKKELRVELGGCKKERKR